MPPDPSLDDGDEQYASSEDSDFAPEAAPEAEASDESDAEETPIDGQPNRRRPDGGAQAQDEGYENSGDEAIIAKGNRKRKRALQKGQLADEDDGGEGGLVKTRAQRAAEKEERKYALNNDPVTVDVDALWAQMISGEPVATSNVAAAIDADADASSQPKLAKESSVVTTANAPADRAQPDTIRIKRTYNFAGRVHTEEKVVARDSAEAKLYLASQGEEAANAETSPTKRATRKAFRSAFEPILENRPGRTDLNLGLAARILAGKEAQAKKLNTVEKSRMDWAGYVDKEGIKDELELASKSKDSYTARQDFLARSEAIREDDARRARVAGKV
ncbi:swr complex subunit [Conoideocrella luteorostrata]|uniref:SWR1-complex protein 5 n=1 Tax=Conoideocrella luteorostrata TaxID=1105319 RepID=A0AAJ0CHA8_9HYPO|nr:swr complex subunit [Conoideocrella luteorostrata]